MSDDYANPWSYRLMWAYLFGVVLILMTPTFYNYYISLNEYGFGAANYEFTTGWYAAVFSDSLLVNAFGWTLMLGLVNLVVTVPLGLLAAKQFKRRPSQAWLVALMLLPLFVPGDIFASALLVFFKTLNGGFQELAALTGLTFMKGWFKLGVTTAVIGLVVYTVPYIFIVILITLGRFHPEQTEAARACGASAWRAFWDVEFPQVKAGVFASCAFVMILTFNEYTRTAILKGGFDTFTTVLVSQMLNTGMSEQSYAMGGIVSSIAIAVIGTVLVVTMLRAGQTERRRRGEEALALPA